MRKSAYDLDGDKYKVIDLDTGKEIKGVQWADDETGEYEVVVFNARGEILRYSDDHPVKKVKKGNIKIVKKE